MRTGEMFFITLGKSATAVCFPHTQNTNKTAVDSLIYQMELTIINMKQFANILILKNSLSILNKKKLPEGS